MGRFDFLAASPQTAPAAKRSSGGIKQPKLSTAQCSTAQHRSTAASLDQVLAHRASLAHANHRLRLQAGGRQGGAGLQLRSASLVPGVCLLTAQHASRT